MLVSSAMEMAEGGLELSWGAIGKVIDGIVEAGVIS